MERHGAQQLIMWYVIWLVLFAAGSFTTIVAFWASSGDSTDPEVVGYSSILNLFIWLLISYSSTNIVSYPDTADPSPIVHASPALALLALLNALVSFVPLILGVLSWYEQGSSNNRSPKSQEEALYD